MPSSNLDFLVIGAQKSGTTALHEYLRRHPEIFLPVGKELPYFTLSSQERPEWHAYLEEYFKEAHPGQRLGKVTPQYMAYPDCAREIVKRLPNVKLVALLRDPIDRAVSHYRMSKLRGWEPRSLAEALESSIDPGHVDRYRVLMPDTVEAETSCYCVWGEYGRILGSFAEMVPRSSMLLIYSEDLSREPVHTVSKVLQFLGVDPTIVPDNVGRRYHVGASTRKFEWIYELGEVPFLVSIWRSLLPKSFRRRLLYVLRERSSSAGRVEETDTVAGLTDQTINRLRTFFERDAELLSSMGEDRIPWLDRWHQETQPAA